MKKTKHELWLVEPFDCHFQSRPDFTRPRCLPRLLARASAASSRCQRRCLTLVRRHPVARSACFDSTLAKAGQKPGDSLQCHLLSSICWRNVVHFWWKNKGAANPASTLCKLAVASRWLSQISSWSCRSSEVADWTDSQKQGWCEFSSRVQT